MSDKTILETLLIPASMSIIDAIEVLNNAHKRIVLVVDDSRRLLGVVTDSNIRHALLEQIDMKSPVSQIMRRGPVTVPPSSSDHEIIRLMETTHCMQIPIVDTDGRVVGIKFIEELLKDSGLGEETLAVIMAGGLGTRLRPYTDKMPKSLVPVGERPLLFTIIDQLFGSGIDKICLTLNYRSDDIRRAIDEIPRYQNRVVFVQEGKKLGTAGPMSILPERPQTSFVVMNGDLLTKAPIDEMLRFHRYQRNVMTMAVRETSYQMPYGVAKIEGTRVVEMQEKPSFTHFVNAGIYVVEPYVLDRIPADTYFDMSDLIDGLLAADLRVGSFPVHEYWVDIGSVSQLEKAQEEFPSVFGDKPTDE